MNYLQIKNNEPILYEGDKVIAGHGTNLKVNLSKLSDEAKKAIGWVDVEALAKLAIPNYENRMDDEIKFAREKFKQGFKAAQSLNERMFTVDDLSAAYDAGLKDLFSAKSDVIKRISAPKLFECEIETEQLLVNDKGKPIYPDKEGIWKVTPRIENNSIKVLKVRI